MHCRDCGEGVCTRCGQRTAVGHGDGEGDNGKCPEVEGLRELFEMAEKGKWKACPWCKKLVEKAEGCSWVACVCGRTFCYGFGRFDGDCACEKGTVLLPAYVDDDGRAAEA